MPRHDPHPLLDRDTAECLRLLSDPELPDSVPLPALREPQAALLTRVARLHGTLSTAHRHVGARQAAGAISAADPIATAFREAESVVLAAVGQTMRLRHRGERVAAACQAEGITSAIVKGPVAARLYPSPSDRLYTDVDLLVAPESVAAVAAILERLDFIASDIPGHDAADHCEFKFTLRSSPAVMVEVQTNLIHSARLRRRASVDLAAVAAAGGGDPGEATALAFVAGVHAACGHQFERLELIIDVLQAARGRAGPVDVERLARVSQESGTLRAVAASYALAGRMYREAACTAIARQLVADAHPLEWQLVSPRVVMTATSRAGWWVAWRRKAFRQMVNRPFPAARIAATAEGRGGGSDGA